MWVGGTREMRGTLVVDQWGGCYGGRRDRWSAPHSRRLPESHVGPATVPCVPPVDIVTPFTLQGQEGSGEWRESELGVGKVRRGGCEAMLQLCWAQALTPYSGDWLFWSFWSKLTSMAPCTRPTFNIISDGDKWCHFQSLHCLFGKNKYQCSSVILSKAYIIQLFQTFPLLLTIH